MSWSHLPDLRLAISAPSVELSSARGALPGCVAHQIVLSTTFGGITPVEQFQANGVGPSRREEPILRHHLPRVLSPLQPGVAQQPFNLLVVPRTL